MPLSISTTDVRRLLLRGNVSWAAGPGCVQRTCVSQLVDNVTDISLSPGLITLCNWTSSQTSDGSDWQLSTRDPQGCVLSLLLFTLCTHDDNPCNGESSVVKYADDTTIIAGMIKLISGGSQQSCCSVSAKQRSWLLTLEEEKKGAKTHIPVYISGAEEEEWTSWIIF